MGIFKEEQLQKRREFLNETGKGPRGRMRSRWDNTLGQTLLRKDTRRTSGGAV